MIDPLRYAAQFGDLAVPATLMQLLAFQNSVGFGNYAHGITLSEQDKSGLTSWSDDAAFLDRLVPFARASASGSFYAFWIDDATSSLEQAPVAVFGDEGGEWIVARDLRELLALSSFDVEPRVDFDRVHFYKNMDHYQPSESLEAYQDWLRTHLQIVPVADPDPLVDAAQRQHQLDFEAWLRPFLERH